MSLRRTALLLALPALAACAAPSARRPRLAATARPAPAPISAPRPPIAHKEPHVQKLPFAELHDDYFWLRRKDSPEVVAYLKAENGYTDAVLQPTVPFQQTLYDEMLARIKETDDTYPYRQDGYLYYRRTEKGKQYPIHCRRKGSMRAPEEVLLDLNEIARTEKYVGLGTFEVSDGGGWLAYALDTTGFRQFTLAFKDLTRGVVAPERIRRVDAAAWARDRRTVFYVVEDPVSKRAHRLFRHVVGEDPAQDKLLYEEKDELYELDLERALSGAYAFVTSYSKTTTEVRVLDLARPTAEPRLLAPREKDHEYYVDHHGGKFFIRTNSGGRNFRLVSAPIARAGDRSAWKEVVPHRADVMLESFEPFADFIVVEERADGLPRLEILDPATGKLAGVEMPEALYSVALADNHEWNTRSFRYHYESPVTPSSVIDHDVRTGKATLRKRQEVLGGFDPERYETQRRHATAADGTRIPISLVYRKGVDPAGKNPMLLSGYGSYGISVPLGFTSDRFSLLDRGVVVAVAHIRGGGDLGKAWHDGGRMMTKMNTFTDFIDCAADLIRSGWTAPERLVIRGGSAGGLLMGAVTNLRPDLWKAVVVLVPFVDVINTMLDESLPLTVGEFEEWGNPKVKEQYDYMIKYSPYDNVTRKPYPAMLVRTSYNDSQVMYWEPAKYVAKLRASKTDRNPLLFKINMDPAGHGGRSGRYEALRETAFDYAFILGQLGLGPAPGGGAATAAAR
jgi:oligopeptidase B